MSCNTKEAKAKRQAEWRKKAAIVKHYTMRWRVQYIANVCKFLKRMLCFLLFILELSTFQSMTKSMYALLCVRFTLHICTHSEIYPLKWVTLCNIYAYFILRYDCSSVSGKVCDKTSVNIGGVAMIFKSWRSSAYRRLETKESNTTSTASSMGW